MRKLPLAHVIDHAQSSSKERDAFETELQEEAGRLIASTIVDAIKARTGTYNVSVRSPPLAGNFRVCQQVSTCFLADTC